MIVKRISPVTGKENSMDLPISQEQINNFNSGMHIQTAFPQLTSSEREFILTGITDEEWNEIFPPEDTDCDDESFKDFIVKGEEPDENDIPNLQDYTP